MIKDIHLLCSPSFCVVLIFKSIICLKFPQSFSFHQLEFSNLLTLIVVLIGTINMWVAKFQKLIRNAVVEMQKSHSDAWASLNDLMIKSNGFLWKKIKWNLLYKVMMFTIKESLHLWIMKLFKKHFDKKIIACLKFACVIINEFHKIWNVNMHFVKNLKLLCKNKKTAMWFIIETSLSKNSDSVKMNFLCWSLVSSDQELVFKLESVFFKYNSSAQQLKKILINKDMKKINQCLIIQTDVLADMFWSYLLQQMTKIKFLGWSLFKIPNMMSECVKLNFFLKWDFCWQNYYNGLQSKMNEKCVWCQWKALRIGSKSQSVLFLNHLWLIRIYTGISELIMYQNQNWIMQNIKKQLENQTETDLFEETVFCKIYHSSVKLQVLIQKCDKLWILSFRHAEQQKTLSKKLMMFTFISIKTHVIDLMHFLPFHLPSTKMTCSSAAQLIFLDLIATWKICI